MTPAANTLLPLIIVSLGILGIILSFMVADRKKSVISLGLAGLVVLTGVCELGSQSIARWRLNRRLESIQRERQTDLEAIRKRLQEQAATAPVTPGKPVAPGAGRPMAPGAMKSAPAASKAK